MNKKVVYYAPEDIRVEEQTEKPPVGEGELLIEVEAAAICGTDIKAYFHGNPKINAPAVIGHEFCGTIIESKTDKIGYEVGKRVTMATTMGCGECKYCKEGRSNICMNAQAMGFACDGAMAKYTVIPAKAVKFGNVIPVGRMDAKLAAVAEPMSCAINGLSRLPIKEIKSAVVIGLGALGMFHALALKSFGVENVVCVDFDGVKKDIMDELGFSTLTPAEFPERYLNYCDDGFDLVIITAPANKVQADAPKYAKKGGYVSYFASLPMGDNMISIDSRLVHYRELVLYGTSDSRPEHVEKAIEILSDRQEDVEKMITVLPIDDFKDGVMGVKEMRYAKVVLIP